MDKNDVMAISCVLAHSRWFTAVSYADATLGRTGTLILFAALSMNTTLVRLKLERVGLSATHARVFKQLAPRLRVLSLSGNPLGDEGAGRLAEAGARRDVCCFDMPAQWVVSYLQRWGSRWGGGVPSPLEALLACRARWRVT